MRIGYLDCFSGVAGDMWVGALLDLGLDLAALQAAVASLQLPGVAIRAERVHRASMAAVHFQVEVPGAPAVPVQPRERPPHAFAMAPALLAAHAGHGTHRNLADMLAILGRAELPAAVRDRCAQVFEVIAAAEARQHGCSVQEVHFHEVGGEDTIVDIVCACLGTHLLGLERLYASRVAVGSGLVRCAHGLLPVPAPATLEILSGIPVRQGDLQGERTTPTGAALLKVLVTGFEPVLEWVPEARGHGAGTRNPPELPNVLRLTVGRLAAPTSGTHLLELQCQLDTATGELIGTLLDGLLQRGAVDAFCTPVQMKKGRPGFLLTVLCDEARAALLGDYLLEESGTLGVRRHAVQRSVLERWQETRETPLGPVRFKVARLPSGVVVARPEDDELKRLMDAHGIGRAELLRRLG